jgi:hypothetical protein
VPTPAVATEPDLCASTASLPTGGTDFRVPAKSGRVWALPFGAVPTTEGRSLKVVWRVTGKGPLRVTFRDPSGDRHPLGFGPDEHSASSFRHPGREWGTGFAFDAPGCWTVQVARTGTVATVGILVT